MLVVETGVGENLRREREGRAVIGEGIAVLEGNVHRIGKRGA